MVGWASSIVRNRFSILVKNEKEKCATLYVKGVDESTRNRIDFEDTALGYLQMIEYNTEKGSKPFIFCKKNLTLKEADNFTDEYILAKKTSLDQDVNLRNLADKMESNLEFIGMTGLKSLSQEDTGYTIRKFTEMGTNIHILTGDTREEAWLCGKALNLTSKDPNNIQELAFSDNGIGHGQIKQILEFINSRVYTNSPGDKEKKMEDSKTFSKDMSATIRMNSRRDDLKLTLLMSGAVIDLLDKDDYIKNHLKFILQFTSTLIGYDLTPHNKKIIITMFREVERRTMAVGDGLNDIQMLQAANVGVQIVNPIVSYQFGDITTNNLASIANSCTIEGRKYHNNLFLVVNSIGQLSICLLFITFFYQIYTDFSGTPVFNVFFITLSYFFLVPISIFFVMFNSTYSDRLRSSTPGLYLEHGFISSLTHIRIFVFHLVRLS
jgi:magnesium-transporting ATPase (P-type)